MCPGAGCAGVDLSWQERMREVWERECGGEGAVAGRTGAGAGPRVVVAGSLQDALALLRRRQAGPPGAGAQAAEGQPQQRQGLRVLATGSLYLVGDTLRLLGRLPVCAFWLYMEQGD